MAHRIRAGDWATTPLGAVDTWPQSLKSAVDACLGSSLASLVWWGSELTQIYNDAARRLLGGTHMEALGVPARDAWSAMWPEMRPLVEQVMSTGLGVIEETTRIEPASGGPPEAYVFSYGALRDEAGAVVGISVTAINASARRESEERRNQDRLRLALEVGQLATWDWDTRSGNVTWNDEHYRMQGYAIGEVTPSFEAWQARVHPDDLAATLQRLTQARELRRDYAHEYRYLLPDGSIRWCSARGRFFFEGSEAVRMIGVTEDITDRVHSEEYQRLLLAELQHRVRNTLSVVRSIARRTAASNDNIDEYTAHFDGRLNAFARTQAAVTRDPAGGVDLGALVAEELIAHGAREDGQVRIGGPKLRLQPKAAETIGLAIHELATNAVKYGALATPAGHVDVRWTIRTQAGDRRLHLDWTENTGGRTITRPRRRGFGLDMLERTLGYDLGAEVGVDFARAGLKCTIELPLDERIAVA
jgi:two-component system CheB/CheR fusion protein